MERERMEGPWPVDCLVFQGRQAVILLWSLFAVWSGFLSVVKEGRKKSRSLGCTGLPILYAGL